MRMGCLRLQLCHMRARAAHARGEVRCAHVRHGARDEERRREHAEERELRAHLHLRRAARVDARGLRSGGAVRVGAHMAHAILAAVAPQNLGLQPVIFFPRACALSICTAGSEGKANAQGEAILALEHARARGHLRVHWGEGRTAGEGAVFVFIGRAGLVEAGADEQACKNTPFWDLRQISGLFPPPVACRLLLSALSAATE